MPNWSGGILTTKGQVLQAKVDAGQVTLTLTKMKIGSGTLPAGQNLQSLNDLVAPEMNVPISSVTSNNNITTVSGVITNTGLANGFNVRELGLFAQDPTLGEILYLITTDSAPDYIPPEGGSMTVSEEFSLNITVSNTATVTAVINPSGLVTVSILNQEINDHNNDPNAHGSLAATKAWKAKHAYALGDVCFSNKETTASYKMMECTLGGTTAETEPTWPAIGNTISDGTVTWKVCDMRHGTTIGRLVELVDVGSGKVGLPAVSGKLLTDISGLPVGSIMQVLSNTPLPGCLAFKGEEYSRATYPDLWTFIQNSGLLITESEWQAQAAVQSSVGFYSSGNGSTTFRLPRIVDYLRGSDVGRGPGSWQADDYKSHVHTITRDYSNQIITNASYVGFGTFNTVSGTAAMTMASSGGTETRPKTVNVLYCIKAFDATTNQGLIDITALANDVSAKQKALAYIRIWDEKGSGSAGGTFTSGAWRTRDLNQKQVFGISVDAVPVSNNQFTLPAGTYEIRASAPAYSVAGHKARLQNITDNSTVLIGTSEYSYTTNSCTTRSIISGSFTISAAKVFEIQHYCGSTASSGFGIPVSIGVSEIYTEINIRKVG